MRRFEDDFYELGSRIKAAPGLFIGWLVSWHLGLILSGILAGVVVYGYHSSTVFAPLEDALLGTSIVMMALVLYRVQSVTTRDAEGNHVQDLIAGSTRITAIVVALADAMTLLAYFLEPPGGPPFRWAFSAVLATISACVAALFWAQDQETKRKADERAHDRHQRKEKARLAKMARDSGVT